jgi:hypothetical protein
MLLVECNKKIKIFECTIGLNRKIEVSQLIRDRAWNVA